MGMALYHIQKSPARVAKNIFFYRRNELKFLDIAEIKWSNQHCVTAINQIRLQPEKGWVQILSRHYLTD